ncbi:MAG: peptidase M48, partial [Myxococcales bacterium]|nr:peptidase M48 [Myxococcales bacterium]
MSRKHGGLALAVVLLATACAINPVSRRPEFVVMSREKEALLGEREAARVAQEMGILPDEGIAAYVARVGARVAQHSRRTDVAYRFL